MNALVWFRNNLRVTDNAALLTAFRDNDAVMGVYCFDPRQFEKTDFGFRKTGSYRAIFLMETVQDLKTQLETYNIPLVVGFGTPEELIPELIDTFQLTSIHTQKEWTTEETAINTALKSRLNNDCEWHEYYDQFLFHPEDIPYTDFKDIPKVFTEFRKKCEKLTDVRECISKPKKQTKHFDTKEISERYRFPTWDDLQLQEPELDSRSAFPFKGGESNGLQRLEDYVWNSKAIKNYKQTRNGLIGTEYSSKFSAWLANGSLSPKTIYWEVQKFEQEVTKNQDTYWMIFELIWRDFFKYISLKHGDALFNLGGILNKDYTWKSSKEEQKQWIKGNTKYPFVNANMKEIAATGWMSNRGRQNVASFWAKELQQDWRIGASYFESLLIDYDVHSNWGNWQYVSGVGNDPRDRKFNIERQAERYDPNGKYVALWNS
ncbi:MAG: DASH family cryptochrome [Marinirhabdus sp.]|nr:DASH family cryptochrome [Marinirhabdus sp.]